MKTQGQVSKKFTEHGLGNASPSTAQKTRRDPGGAALLHERINLLFNARPSELRRATGQVVLNLWMNPMGLSKKSLMELADAEFSQRSFQYVLSLEAALNKRIQRARRRVRGFGLDIVFEPKQRVWKLAAC